MPNGDIAQETASIKDEDGGQEMGTAQVCAYLGISRRTLGRLASAQGIPAQERWKEFGKELLYKKEDIEKLKAFLDKKRGGQKKGLPRLVPREGTAHLEMIITGLTSAVERLGVSIAAKVAEEVINQIEKKRRPIIKEHWVVTMLKIVALLGILAFMGWAFWVFNQQLGKWGDI
jgi:hypothetical protein